jgi:hypothetical protein
MDIEYIDGGEAMDFEVRGAEGKGNDVKRQATEFDGAAESGLKPILNERAEPFRGEEKGEGKNGQDDDQQDTAEEASALHESMVRRD